MTDNFMETIRCYSELTKNKKTLSPEPTVLQTATLPLDDIKSYTLLLIKKEKNKTMRAKCNNTISAVHYMYFNPIHE